ncbi:MAG: CHRD domain-containing protein [Chloroflexi bacterium]|nr:CHRD domain-containing protein [Chloroflexota bacterium]
MLVPRMLSSSPATSFKAVLSGTDEVPPAATMATGEAAFTLSPNGLALTYVLTVSGITDATAAHIHLAPAGVSGPVVAPLFAGPQPGTFSGILAQGTITAESLTGLLLGKPLSALIAEINAGNAYVNVHTTVHPAGEIRGQVRPVLP